MNVYGDVMVGNQLLVSLETAKACYTCFKCVGICPVGLRPNMFVKAYVGSIVSEFRDIYESIIRDSSIWVCAKCLKCVEICPQHVPIIEVIEYLQYMASKHGVVPKAYLNMIENVVDTYIAFSSQTIVTREGDIYLTEDVRNTWGLNPLPNTQDIEGFRRRLKEIEEAG
uniref:4Fe-4S dicluster domain-containing protein n=1 Tax=Ignisphaera aggregans TaxID=334771 RepID=A0A7C5TGA8_9CREN